MLLQHASAAGTHPLAGTAAEWMWLLPILPLIGFIVNGVLAWRAVAHVGPADPDIHGAHAADGHAHDAHAGHADAHHVPTRHPYAGITTIVGPLVMVLAFGLAVLIWMAMLGAHPETPFVQR